MGRQTWLLLSVAILFALAGWAGQGGGTGNLEAGFQNPPPEAGLHCYWWWINGNTDEQTITRDLEAMKANGYGGAEIIDAAGAGIRGNTEVPLGPTFGTPEWRVLYRHTLKEANRLGLVLSLSPQSGWNLGGPMVQPQEGPKLLTWSRVSVQGPAQVHQSLPEPPKRYDFYADIAVLALPLHHGAPLPGAKGSSRPAIPMLRYRIASLETGGSAPDPAPLLQIDRGEPGDQDADLSEVRDLSQNVGADGVLNWQAPAGEWEILRMGYTVAGPVRAHVSNGSGKWQGLVVDPMNGSAFDHYWDQVIAPLMEDAKPYLGNTLQFLVTDSWESGGVNWTSGFREEFRSRRGYDLLPYLPVVAGRIIGSRETSEYFLNDLRRTVGDLIDANHYSVFAEHARSVGLSLHCESGGPHGAPIDALQLLGIDSMPMTEFWGINPARKADENRFFTKEASSAAHVYGKRFVAAEGPTSIGPQWEERIWNDLRPTFDQAFAEGLNLNFWHTFSSSPAKFGLPGEEYFAGTHFNPNVTWWKQSRGWTRYIDRCQFLMQQGLPVSDVLYYYGDFVPNFVRVKSEDPAQALPGYDYDVTSEDALINRVAVKNGELVLPDGVTYRLLVLPQIPLASLRALQKIAQLVSDGATVIGPKPVHTTGIDTTGGALKRLADSLWGDQTCDGVSVVEHHFGQGRVICGETAREVLTDEHVKPDFEVLSPNGKSSLDYAHRRSPDADIYFIRNANAFKDTVQITLRVSGKQPELWQADSGKILQPAVYDFTSDGRTRMPMSFQAYGSVFVVFQHAAQPHAKLLTWDGKRLFPLAADELIMAAPPEALPQVSWADGSLHLESALAGLYEGVISNGEHVSVDFPTNALEQGIKGTWEVRFTPGWGAPASTRFQSLISWPESTDPGIRYYSGTATYSTDVNIPAALLGKGRRLEIDLGEVREFAEVTLNGHSLGTLWEPPFRIDIASAAHVGLNHLQVSVTNLWPNRLIGDAQPGVTHPFTHTNVQKFTKDSPLLPSGLLGPVRLVSTEIRTAKLADAPGNTQNLTRRNER